MSQFDTNPELRFADDTLVVRRDEFSVQIRCTEDPHFWVRLEIEAEGATFSDLMTGHQPSERAARAMRLALETAQRPLFGPAVFLDVAPGSADLAERQRKLRAVAGKFAQSGGRFVASFECRDRRGKTDIVVSFD